MCVAAIPVEAVISLPNKNPTPNYLVSRSVMYNSFPRKNFPAFKAF